MAKAPKQIIEPVQQRPQKNNLLERFEDAPGFCLKAKRERPQVQAGAGGRSETRRAGKRLKADVISGITSAAGVRAPAAAFFHFNFSRRTSVVI